MKNDVVYRALVVVEG